MMPLHRRHGGANKALDNESAGFSIISPDGAGRNEHGKGGLIMPSLFSKQQHAMMVACLVFLQMIAMGVAAIKVKVQSFSHLISILFAAFITSLPAFLLLGVGLGVVGSSSRDLPHQRYIPLAIVGTIIGNQLPSFLSAGMAAAGIYIFGLASRPLPLDVDQYNKKKVGSSSGVGADDDIKKTSTLTGPLKTVFASLLMVAVLLMDNFFVWVVAATYKPSQSIVAGDLPKPLQDNGQITMNYLFGNVLALTKREVVKVRGIINVEWLLVSGLGLSLVAMEIHGPAMRRNLWSVSKRGVLTLAAARSIRIFSYLITVLPSQNPRCYFGHFPYPPPQEWIPWLMVGVIPQVNGGCNDLIISGHATATATMACVVTSVVGKPLFTAALWMFVAMDYMVEVFEGFHYSVDMFLGAVLVNFIWTVMASMEESGPADQAGRPKKFYPLLDISHSDLVKYLVPVLAAYFQVIGLIPQDLGVYSIVVYMVVVVYQVYRFGFQQYTQHTLFCLLYIGLGVFL
jgi:hypothetical protein